MDLLNLPPRVDVIGVPITATNMDECLDFILENIDALRGEYVCVSNVHTTVMAHDDPAYMEVQTHSVMSIPDGKPLSVLGKRQCPTMDRVTGPDLMRALFTSERAVGARHFFYGNSEENLNALIDRLRETYPKLRIAGYEPSVFREMTGQEESDLVDRVNRSGADYVWVAIGAPRQENLCHRLMGRVDGLMIGVGGAFNIIAGIVPEAPRWMQNLSLEWLYRLIQEPGRLFKRYAITNGKFVLYVLTGTPPRQSRQGSIR